MNRPKLRSAGRERGAALFEFVVVIPLFGVLVFGLFEMALMYRTKATLSAATFEAAQAGSLYNAQIDPIRKGFAQGMMPLYVKSRTPGAVATAFAETYAKLRLGLIGSVDIVSPSRSVFNQFKKRQPTTLGGESTERNIEVIPNDNLMWRSADVRTVRVDNQNVQMTVQDANVLKVKTFWCHRLLTPVLDKWLYQAITGLTAVSAVQYRRDVPEQVKCDLLPGDGLAGDAYYIALTDSAVARMQSATVANNLPN
ncbi:TadE/TadG family type IV pilus assembly protein [Tahibacter soli]|jgi:hypothetical protein|uniref:Pilus assembly protein n=1 Tax=Tahibacter soli TaxID=2983605 RepID=A0A9X3YPB4_9GAMM|nr:TadE/TadG family type IV pilus assembly protein [Tahibacter soli]MDC8015967.1 pilus assembly protein [Tahibacter soli]